MPTLTPQAFVAKWRSTTLKERSAAQEHFIDVCRLVGHPTPAEAGATKQAGGQGWADVWKKGFFAWEYKGKHADLDKAYQQLLQYREALHNPPLLVVSDIDQIVIHTNFTNTIKRVETVSFEALLTPAGMATLRAVFYEPNTLRAPQTTEQVTNLYNQRPTWLELAHQKLDRAVLDAYGWPHGIGDEAILERLLALNLERAGS